MQCQIPHSHTHTSLAKTQLGVWLIKDLHRVSDNVAELTYTALAYLSVFPLIDAIVRAWQ